MSANRFFEGLESRALMSAAPSPLTQTVQLDHVQIRADLLKFRSDMLSGFVTFQTDVIAIKADGAGNASTVVPLIDTFFKDVKTMRTALKADLLDQSKAVNRDEALIQADMKNIRLDKKAHDKAGNRADHEQLLADRIQLQSDMVAGLSKRIKTRQDDFTILADDMNAIIAAAQSDPNASPQLLTDLQKAQADETNRLNALITDLSTIKADRTKLIADLTAMQSAEG